jgi:hypothetical protein
MFLTDHLASPRLGQTRGTRRCAFGRACGDGESFCGIDIQVDTPGLIGGYADARWSLTGVDAVSGVTVV